MKLRLIGTIFYLVVAPLVGAEPLKLNSTSPQFWATNVNPALQKKVSLTFDQRLRARMTDWIGLDVLSPPSDLQTTFSPDHMSCSINVHLDPGHVYVCALNERAIPGVGFQNEKGLALPPTYLVFQTVGNPSPEDAPPRIIRTIPDNGTQIDVAKVNAISVIFDRAMNVKKHGLHLTENGGAIDPTKSQFSYSSDGRTFTLAYRFKPAAQYHLELNSTQDIGFSSAKRVPLWPVQLSFTTSR
jgi:hypothetical protein